MYFGKLFDEVETNLNKEIELESDTYIQRAIETIAGFLISNKFKIEINDSSIKSVFMENDKVEEEFQITLKDILIKALPKILVYGFIFYRVDPDDEFGIELINFDNGSVYYKVNKQKKVEMFWLWKEVNFFSQSSLRYDMRKFDKKVFNFTYYPLNFNGKVTSPLSYFSTEKQKLNFLEKILTTLEKRKVNREFYMQRMLPELKPDQYEVFQNHTAIANRSLDEIDSMRKRFLNMYNIRNALELHVSDSETTTQEHILRFFQISNYYSYRNTEYDFSGEVKKKIPTFGELVQPKFLDIVPGGDFYKEKLEEYKKNINGYFGIERGGNQNLRDNVRLSGFFIRPVIIKIQCIIERFLNECVNMCYLPIFKLIKYQDQEIDEEQVEELKTSIQIRVDPILYVSSDELQLIKEFGPTFDAFVKLILGSEFLFVTKDADPNRGKTPAQ